MTKSKRRSLWLTPEDIQTHPRVVPRIGQLYATTTVFELNFKIVPKPAFRLIASFKYLQSIVLYGYQNSSMYGMIRLYWQLPYRIQKISLNSLLVVNSIRMFNYFTYTYEYKAYSLNLKFSNNSINYDLNFIDDCVQNLRLFKKLRYLKIHSPIDYQQFNFISKLNLKQLTLTNVRNKYVNKVLTSVSNNSTLQMFTLFCAEQPISVNTDIKSRFRSVRGGLQKIRKFGYFYVNQKIYNLNNFVYVPKAKFMIINQTQEISNLFKNKIFNDLKYLVYISNAFDINLFEMLLKNQSICTLILEEQQVSQNLINLFISKAIKNPNKIYSIGVSSVLEPYNYKILLNFSVFLQTKFIFNNKIVSFE